MTIGYDYVIEHYSGKRQLEHYTERVFERGLSEAERVLLEYYFQEDHKILDVGTGCGRFAINAFRSGYTKMFGIDMNQDLITQANYIAKDSGFDINFSFQNAESTSFNDCDFDSVIFTSDGFSQVPGNENKLKVLKELHRILKPSGVCIIAVIDEQLVRQNDPKYAAVIDSYRSKKLWKERGFFDANDVVIYDGGYIHFAPVEETTQLIKKAGFTLLYNATAKDILGYNDSKSSNISRFFVLRK